MSGKVFHLKPEQIKPRVRAMGSCMATDLITVQGGKVGFMYRETPDNKLDSGWRFFTGHEPDGYTDDAKNIGIYDVNTIANYDPDIIPLLKTKAPAAFERSPETGAFAPVDPPPTE